MAGIWIIAENRGQTLELLNIGCELAANMGTQVSAFIFQDRECTQDYIDCGADEVLLLPPLADNQSLDAYIPRIVEEATQGDPDLILIPATARGKEMAARIHLHAISIASHVHGGKLPLVCYKRIGNDIPGVDDSSL